MADLMYSKSQDKYYRQNDLGEFIEVPKYIAEKSAGESAMIAAGETMAGVWDWLAPESMQIGVNEPTNKMAMQGLREQNPIATTVGDVLPSLATAPVTFGSGLIGNLAGQAALGAGTEYLLSGGDGRAAAYGALGGFGGEIAGRIMGRAYNAVKGAMRGADELSGDALRYVESGGEVYPSQRFEGRGLTNIESTLKAGTFSGEPFEDIAIRNQQNLNDLAVNALNLKGVTDLSQSGFVKAEEAIAQEFQDVASKIGRIDLDMEMIDDFKKIAPDIKWIDSPELDQAFALQKEAAKEGSQAIAPDVVNLPANQLMQIRTELTGQLATETSPTKIAKIGEYLDYVDNVIEGQASKEAANAYQSARKKYELLSVMKKGNVVKEGDVSMNLLRNALKNHYGNAFELKMGDISPEMGMLAQNVSAGTSKSFQAPFGRPGTAEASQSLLSPKRLYERPLADWYLKNPERALGFVGGLNTPASKMSPVFDRFARGLMSGSFRGLGRDYTEE
jgi:hypothetical protein